MGSSGWTENNAPAGSIPLDELSAVLKDSTLVKSIG